MPLVVASVWFFTSTRLPATTATPSMVCKPDNVMLPVVATSTGALTATPGLGSD